MNGTFLKEYGVQVKDVISQVGTVPATDLSLLLTSRRGNRFATTPLVLQPLSIPLYTPVIVPQQYTNGGSQVLEWCKSVGATIKLGTSGKLTLAAPTSVQVTNGQYVTLSWSAKPYGWDELVGAAITGSVTQSTAAGSIFSVSQLNYSLIMKDVTGTFDTTDPVVIQFINQSNPIPNGTLTEEWVLCLYYACEAANPNYENPNVNFNKPQINISIVSDRDAYYRAVDTEVDLGQPNLVTVNSDNTVLLAWDVTPTGWEYVPTTKLGESLIEQGAVKGVLMQQMGPQYSSTGTGVSLLVNNVTGGTFATGTDTTMVLDDEVSVFDVLGTKYYPVVASGYEITTANDYNVLNRDFVDYIRSVNTPQATMAGRYGTEGIFAQTSTAPGNYLGNVQPDYGKMLCGFYPYSNFVGDPYIKAGQVASSLAAVIASNDLPFAEIYNVPLNGLPVSSNPSDYIDTSPNGQGEAILQYGYTPLVVNQQQDEVIIYMPVTTQITVPGTLGLIDQEFYDLRTQQVITEVNERLVAAMKAPQFVNGFINPKTEATAHTAIYAALKSCETDTLIINVDRWKSYIVVVQSEINPHELNISCNVQVGPALTKINITVNVVSSLITPPTTQA